MITTPIVMTRRDQQGNLYIYLISPRTNLVFAVLQIDSLGGVSLISFDPDNI